MASNKINLDRLSDNLLVTASENPALLDELLREEGYNPEALEKAGVQKIKRLLFASQVAVKKQQFSELYTKALEKFKSATDRTKQQILSLLQEKSPKLQFRNLENLDEENLRQILDETELLELMEKIEKDNS